MSHKSQVCYEHVFTYLNENVFELTCISFTTDYENAMRNALQKLFPDVRRYACYFHFCQAVKKHAWQTNGLVALIRSSSEARSVYYRLLCLPLLPPQHITNMFSELKKEANQIKFDGVDVRLVFRPFLKYFQRQWIVRVSIASLQFTLRLLYKHK